MTVVLLSSDLMGASRVESAVRQVGVDFRMVQSVDAAVACCAKQTVALVIADLAAPGTNITALVERIKGSAGIGPAIVAFGPHVHESVLERAASAGCDHVLSRGQFMNQVDVIVAAYAAAH